MFRIVAGVAGTALSLLPVASAAQVRAVCSGNWGTIAQYDATPDRLRAIVFAP